MAKGYWTIGGRMPATSGDAEILTISVGRVADTASISTVCRELEARGAAGAASAAARVRDEVAAAVAGERDALATLEAREAKLRAEIEAAAKDAAANKAAVAKALRTGVDPTAVEDAYTAARKLHKRLTERVEPLAAAVKDARAALEQARQQATRAAKQRLAQELAAQVDALATEIADRVFESAPAMAELRGALEAARA
ncbi:unnamed protein product [Gemmataceae bacterium]|nr:unnamed protein product [Gemmataceae bacterium]VTT98867.1 unnamed protein product [Gemmataceae bacterium]